MQSVGKITCPDSTQCLAIGTGDSTSPTDPTIFTAPIASGSGQASTWINDTFPANTGSVTGISCTSTTCVAIGTMSGSSATAAVWTGLLNGGGSDQWQQATTIPVVDSVTAVACGQPAGNDGADCEIAAVTSSTSGELIEGSLAQNGGWVWNPTTFTSDNAVEYYSGVACESPPSSNNSACAASAVTPSGPIIVTSASGPSGTWTTETPSSLPGATVTGVPVETTPASQSNWSTNVDYQPGGSSNATSLPGYLYPYADGYSVVAGDCGAEANATGAEATLSALPGGTAAGTVPLGLLPLQVRNSTGAAAQRSDRHAHGRHVGLRRGPTRAPAHRRQREEPNCGSLRDLPLHRYRRIDDHPDELRWHHGHDHGRRRPERSDRHHRHHRHRAAPIDDVNLGDHLSAQPGPGVVMNAALLRWRGRRLIGDGGRQRRREPRHRGDEGFTLTELLIASTLLVVLLTVVMTHMSLVSSGHRQRQPASTRSTTRPSRPWPRCRHSSGPRSSPDRPP